MGLSSEVEDLFHRLADLDDGEREHYFVGNPTVAAIRQQVESLLAHDNTRETNLNSLIRGQVEAIKEPDSCGPYRLLRMLGSGGMSEVWLAERIDGVLKRPVALKLPFGGIRGDHFFERLSRERDILATLEHPGIARLYDAGLADGRRPFLALEFVEGSNLSAYCNGKAMPVKERLKLFLQVLETVQYAHSRLVIHRDLKPSNILVTSAGEVKLLDFGIAKLMTDGEAAETELTRVGGRALTLSFASPEQIEGKPVTTASDVFSLGLVLFELVSGGRPFSPKRNTSGALEEAMLNEEALRPSQCVTSPEQTRQRSTTLGSLQRALRGDVDVIVSKAIQRRPEDRYLTAEAFGADIRRHLSGEPVLAQPKRPFYRAGKFVIRHRLGLAAAIAILLALTAGLATALWQAEIARREARTANAVEQFTHDIFRLNNRDNPNPEKAQKTTARQLLDMGAHKITTSLNDAPEARLRMLEFLGSLYQSLDLSDAAVELERNRVATARKLYGSQSPKVAAALVALGVNMHASSSVNQREAVLLEAKSILDKSGDFTSPQRGKLLSALAENYTSSDVEKGAMLARESVEIMRRWPPSEDTALVLYTAGFAYLTVRQYAEAEKVLTEATRLSKQFNGDPNIDLPRYYATNADAQTALFDYGRASDSYRQAYKYAKVLGGDDDVDTLETEARLGTFLAQTSRAKEGLPYLAKALSDCLRTKGQGEPFFTPQLRLQYGVALAAVGRPEEALTQIAAAVKNRREHRPGTAYLGQMLNSEAAVLLDLGRKEEAQAALREEQTIREKVHLKIDDFFLAPRIRLALDEGRADEASGILNEHYSDITSASPLSIRVLRSLNARAELACQKKDGAATITLASQVANRLSGTPQEPYLEMWSLRALQWEARGHLLQGNANDALPLLKRCAARERMLLDSKSTELAATEALLGRVYFETGDRAGAKNQLRMADVGMGSHKQVSNRYLQPVEDLNRQLKKD